MGAHRIVANITILSLWPRVYLAEHEWNGNREDCTQEDSSQKYRGECNLLSHWVWQPSGGAEEGQETNSWVRIHSGTKPEKVVFLGSGVCETCRRLVLLLYKENSWEVLRSRLLAEVNICILGNNNWMKLEVNTKNPIKIIWIHGYWTVHFCMMNEIRVSCKKKIRIKQELWYNQPEPLGKNEDCFKEETDL